MALDDYGDQGVGRLTLSPAEATKEGRIDEAAAVDQDTV
jgi:hypothetical protein